MELEPKKVNFWVVDVWFDICICDPTTQQMAMKLLKRHLQYRENRGRYEIRDDSDLDKKYVTIGSE